MKKIYKLMIAVAIVCALVAVLYFGGLSQYVSLEYIKLKATLLKQHAVEHYVSTVAGYIALFAAMIAFGLPVTAPLGVLGGFLFGLITGFLYAMLVVFIGTTVSFLMIRRTLSQVVRAQYKAQLDAFNAQMHQYGFTYLISLHLLSVVPYFLINTLAALANVPLATFMWTTMLGAIPSIFIYVFAGQQLYQIQSWGDILSVHMLAILGLLALLALIPMIIRKYNKTQH